MPANARTPEISPPAPARLLRRFAAMVYDSLLLMALALAYGALVTWLNVLLQGAPAEGERVDWGLWRLPVFMGMLVVLAGVVCFFGRRARRSSGLGSWRVHLVHLVPRCRPSRKHGILRVVLGPVSLLCLGVGYFGCWLDPQKHTFHGRMSRTPVVLPPRERH